MRVTQNEKIRQVTETTVVIVVIGVDIASEIHWARAFDRRGLELGKAVKFENSAEGFQFFAHWLSELAAEQKKSSVTVGLEPTGHYTGSPWRRTCKKAVLSGCWSIHIM